MIDGLALAETTPGPLIMVLQFVGLFGTVNRIDAGPMQLDVPEWTTIEPGAVLLSLAAFVGLTRYKPSMVWVLIGCVLAGAAYWWVRYG